MDAYLLESYYNEEEEEQSIFMSWRARWYGYTEINGRLHLIKSNNKFILFDLFKLEIINRWTTNDIGFIFVEINKIKKEIKNV